MYDAKKKREYYLKNKAKILKYQKEYREKHFNYLSIQAKDKYIKNKPRIIKKVQEYNKKNPYYKMKVSLKNLYGLSIEEYHSMLDIQNGKCFICGGINKSGRRLHVDHNHSTGKVRSLLCANCNSGIAHFKENISILEKAISYLEMHNGT